MRRFLGTGLCALCALALGACSPHPRFPPGDAPATRNYVGLSKEQAIARAAGAGSTWRVLREDGKRFPATKDLRPSRLNFVIERGIVVEVIRG